jgi:hypothetical protein
MIRHPHDESPGDSDEREESEQRKREEREEARLLDEEMEVPR